MRAGGAAAAREPVEPAGFERREAPGADHAFEQLLANFAAEAMHALFLRDVFSAEPELCREQASGRV